MQVSKMDLYFAPGCDHKHTKQGPPTRKKELGQVNHQQRYCRKKEFSLENFVSFYVFGWARFFVFSTSHLPNLLYIVGHLCLQFYQLYFIGESDFRLISKES